MECTLQTHGLCQHCGKKPAIRLPLRLCAGCSDELFHLPVGRSPERKEWWDNNVA